MILTISHIESVVTGGQIILQSSNSSCHFMIYSTIQLSEVRQSCCSHPYNQILILITILKITDVHRPIRGLPSVLKCCNQNITTHLFPSPLNISDTICGIHIIKSLLSYTNICAVWFSVRRHSQQCAIKRFEIVITFSNRPFNYSEHTFNWTVYGSPFFRSEVSDNNGELHNLLALDYRDHRSCPNESLCLACRN